MRIKLYSPMFMIKILGVISVLMFISLLVSPKIAAIGLLVWSSNIGWILHLLTKGQKQSMMKYYNRTLDESKNNKQYFKHGVYTIALPLCIVGVIVMFLDIFALFIK